MDINQELNAIYTLYEQKQYPEAMKKVQDILAVEPQNIYAKRYENLLKYYLQDKSVVGKIATVKGKNLKCPHCQNAISLSALDSNQKEALRNSNYENLQIKCPYCHTQFTLQKKSLSSMFGIKIGDTIQYLGEKYRVTGGVLYKGQWEEGSYSGDLHYFEWILVSDNNTYLYFSEGYFMDDGERKYEYEFSQKIIPDFSIEFTENNIAINGKNKNFSEKNFVSAKTLYGENSKVFTVGEEVELYEFSHDRKSYVLEKERAGRQSEAGIYKTWSISKDEVFKIFGREALASQHKNEEINDEISVFSGILIIVGIIFAMPFFTIIFWSVESFLLIFGFYAFAILLALAKKHKVSVLYRIFITLPILGVILFTASSGRIFEKKVETNLQNISEGKKYEIEFRDAGLKAGKITGTTYDYGGVIRHYETRRGLKFSVVDENDKKIIEKIQSGENIPELTRQIFSEKIYKLK